MKIREIETLVVGRLYRVQGSVRIGNLEIEPQRFDRVLMYLGTSDSEFERYHNFRHLETGRRATYRVWELEHVELARR